MHASIEHITLEERDAVLTAVDAFDMGLDFADALHVARRPASGDRPAIIHADGIPSFRRRQEEG